MTYEIEEYFSISDFINSVVTDLHMVYDLDVYNYSFVSIVCKGELTEKLFKYISNYKIGEKEFEYGYLDFDTYDYDGEYGIVLIKENEGYRVNIDKALCPDGDYMSFEGGLVYINDKCNSKVLTKQLDRGNDVICFYIED